MQVWITTARCIDDAQDAVTIVARTEEAAKRRIAEVPQETCGADDDWTAEYDVAVYSTPLLD